MLTTSGLQIRWNGDRDALIVQSGGGKRYHRATASAAAVNNTSNNPSPKGNLNPPKKSLIDSKSIRDFRCAVAQLGLEPRFKV